MENKGLHISNEHLDKVCKHFYRGGTSRQRSEGCKELGIVISKNILELHGVKYGVMNSLDSVLLYLYLNINK